MRHALSPGVFKSQAGLSGKLRNTMFDYFFCSKTEKCIFMHLIPADWKPQLFLLEYPQNQLITFSFCKAAAWDITSCGEFLHIFQILAPCTGLLRTLELISKFYCLFPGHVLVCRLPTLVTFCLSIHSWWQPEVCWPTLTDGSQGQAGDWERGQLASAILQL